MTLNRRDFLALGALASAMSAVELTDGRTKTEKTKRFEMSLSQWSFHRTFFGKSRENYDQFIKTLHSSPEEVLLGERDPRDIVLFARELEIDYVDLVNILWFGHAKSTPWLTEFKNMAQGVGVGFKILMCDQLGSIGGSELNKRMKAVEAHKPWMEAAAELGCSQLRVNADGDGSYLEQLRQCSESLHALSELGEEYQLEVLVENHGLASNNGAWLAMLIEMTAHPNCGILADFDNFFMGGWGLDPQRRYDRTQGLIDIGPYARGISAKAHHFNRDGEESTISFENCLDILMEAGFEGTVSVEYEGNILSEWDGSKATADLLRKYQ